MRRHLGTQVRVTISSAGRHFALAIVAGFLAFSGCIDAGGKPGPETFGQPPVLAPRPIELLIASTEANFTECQGSFVVFSVPSDWVQDDVPDAYRVDAATPFHAAVNLHSFSCENVSIGASEIGPADLMFLMVYVDNPSNESERPADTLFFVLETRTNNQELRQWLTETGLSVANGTVSHQQKPLATYFETKARIDDEGEMVYRVHGLTSGGAYPQDATYRFFYGPDPETDYFDGFKDWVISGSTQAELEAAPGSKMTDVIQGQTRWVTPLSAVLDASLTLTRPSVE